MQNDIVRFDRFALDVSNRVLTLDGVPVELPARAFDVLALLVAQPGSLVGKDRFMAEVWRGVPVTDEALTQCVRSLRRALGDDANRPRFIETVPKHGYRFVGASGTFAKPATSPPIPVRTGIAATLGGTFAGLLGGLIYGSLAQPAPGTGASSALIVVLGLCAFVGTLGASGTGFGIALGARRGGGWQVFGGVTGGMIIGGVINLVVVDAFALLVGAAPRGITGGAEGAVIGGALGVAALLAGQASPRRGAAWGALFGGSAGALIPLLGGRMMSGSLARLAETFPDGRLRLEPLAGLAGEPASPYLLGALEGALFGACVIGAMRLAEAARK